jgi:segregation and condensation protein B
MSQTPVLPLEDEELKGQLETLLFITDHPLTIDDLRKLTKVKDVVRLNALVGEIRQKFEESKSPLQVLEIAGGFQMATRPVYGELVRKLFAEKMTMRLSTAAHETLAIVAYKQPLTRAEIEDIRGVEVIAALETLLEKHLVKVVGRKDTVGRPLLYGTTADFMRHFGLRSLEDLPPLDNFQSQDAPGPTAEAPGVPQETPALDAVAEAPSEPSGTPQETSVTDASAADTTEVASAGSEPPTPVESIWPGAEEPSAGDASSEGQPAAHDEGTAPTDEKPPDLGI